MPNLKSLFAAKQGINEQAAIEAVTREKAEEFKKVGAEIYVKA